MIRLSVFRLSSLPRAHPTLFSPNIAQVEEDEDKIIDIETFTQILDLDEDDTHDFSFGMTEAYFSQANTTFTDMDEALWVARALSCSLVYPNALPRILHALSQ